MLADRASDIVEPEDPFRALFQAQGDACDKCGQHHATADCPHYPLDRVAHEDAWSVGKAPHMLQNHDSRRLADNHWLINGQTFLAGFATGLGSNCLIDTFRQLLPADVPSHKAGSTRKAAGAWERGQLLGS